MSGPELPEVTIGEPANGRDCISISTYRWEDYQQRDHGPESGILVSLGVYTSGVFYHARGRFIARSEFVHFRRDIEGMLDGQAETAAISAVGNAFSFRLSRDNRKFAAIGSIVDARSGEEEHFAIGALYTEHLATAAKSLQVVLDWFDLPKT